MPCAVVTGSSSGIGLATAELLARHGYSLILHCHRSLGKLQESAKSIESSLTVGASLRCITADVRSQAACKQLVQACFYWKSNIDLWVNNAGADVLTTDLRDRSFETKLERLWQVDVMGTIQLSRLVADRMLKQQNTVSHSIPGVSLPPCIINVGWDQAYLGMEGEPGQLFCPIKAAVMAFTSALSMTLGPLIRVNTVAPGWIQTAWGNEAASPRWRHRATQESLLERWGTPTDVAETICWLASSSASFVNGQTICVNGGRRYFPTMIDS